MRFKALGQSESEYFLFLKRHLHADRRDNSSVINRLIINQSSNIQSSNIQRQIHNQFFYRKHATSSTWWPNITIGISVYFGKNSAFPFSITCIISPTLVHDGTTKKVIAVTFFPFPNMGSLFQKENDHCITMTSFRCTNSSPLMPHICVSVSIGSDIGLSPIRRQAIIWTNTGILLIEPLGTKLCETLIEIHTFSLKDASETIVCEMAAILSMWG